jgi:hypothetical protein
MILLIGAWYNEVGYSFNFSHKVDGFIREQITTEIFTKYNLDNIEDNWYLNLIVATDSHTIKLDVRGPERRKRQKMIDYGLWLPYDYIMKSENPLEKYIDCFFDALVIIFANYGVEKQDVLDLKSTSKKEILNNPVYTELSED